MEEKNTYEIYREDYSQSANTLFHFMKEAVFLKDMLVKKAIIPRYCNENIDYLNIKLNDIDFNEIGVLQKCFCDIPFHKLSNKYYLKEFDVNFSKVNSEEQKESSINTHTDFYGEYAIAFSKKWGECHNLQPVHYINVDEKSEFFKEFCEYANHCINSDDLFDWIADDFLNRLAYIKPLRGIMKRRIKTAKQEQDVDIYKNFHDEKEWRYVPCKEELRKFKMEKVIANPNLLANHRVISDMLVEEKYKALWLRYEYDDVRYLIVPNNTARIDLIRTILDLPAENFNRQESIQKCVLISKIVVLDEIRKDW